MHALIHLLASILVVPYLALAGFFLLIGEVARTKGLVALVALLDVSLEHALWILGWGIYLLPLLWLILAASGAVPRFQRAAALVLGLLASGSLVTIVTLESSPIELGHVLFLGPCLGVVAVSIWLYVRASANC